MTVGPEPPCILSVLLEHALRVSVWGFRELQVVLFIFNLGVPAYPLDGGARCEAASAPDFSPPAPLLSGPVPHGHSLVLVSLLSVPLSFSPRSVDRSSGRVFCDVMNLCGVGRGKAGAASGVLSLLIGVAMFCWGLAGSIQTGAIQTTVFIGAWIAKEAVTVLNMVRRDGPLLCCAALCGAFLTGACTRLCRLSAWCLCVARRRGKGHWPSTQCSRHTSGDEHKQEEEQSQ